MKKLILFITATMTFLCAEAQILEGGIRVGFSDYFPGNYNKAVYSIKSVGPESLLLGAHFSKEMYVRSEYKGWSADLSYSYIQMRDVYFFTYNPDPYSTQGAKTEATLYNNYSYYGHLFNFNLQRRFINYWYKISIWGGLSIEKDALQSRGNEVSISNDPQYTYNTHSGYSYSDTRIGLNQMIKYQVNKLLNANLLLIENINPDALGHPSLISDQPTSKYGLLVKFGIGYKL